MYFKTTLDNDITYLLSQIGHNCHVNNIPAKAIVSNIDRADNYDDKRIITHEQISRGDYINYADKYFLVVDNVNDKRYNTYYKATMRLCNHDFKIIIGNKLYLFYACIDGNKFALTDIGVIDRSADNITVTMPATSITRQIIPQMAFIKWGSRWEVQGIDHTQAGLVTLHCTVKPLNETYDDIENEIADRWKDGQDVLNGNIIPIPPILFEYTLQLNIIDQDNNPVSGASVTLLDAYNNTIEAVSYGFYKVVEGLYTYTVSKEGYTTAEGQIMVDDDIIRTIVLEEMQGDNYNIIISGADSIFITDKATYTATVCNNNVEVDEPVTFTLSNTSLAKIESQGNNQCVVRANSNFNTGRVTLRATLINDETVFAEKEIRIAGM